MSDLEQKGSLENTIKEIKVYNVPGKLVKSSSGEVLNLSACLQGIYNLGINKISIEKILLNI